MKREISKTELRTNGSMKHAKTFVNRKMSIRVAGSCNKHFAPLDLMALTSYILGDLGSIVLSENLGPSRWPAHSMNERCHIMSMTVYDKCPLSARRGSDTEAPHGLSSPL